MPSEFTREDYEHAAKDDSPPAYADPGHPGNSPKHRTGKPCIERGCENPAGTAWSPFWCQSCNAARMDRITASLDRVLYEQDAGTTCPRCKRPAVNLFSTPLPGEELETMHCGCLYDSSMKGTP